MTRMRFKIFETNEALFSRKGKQPGSVSHSLRKGLNLGFKIQNSIVPYGFNSSWLCHENKEKRFFRFNSSRQSREENLILNLES